MTSVQVSSGLPSKKLVDVDNFKLLRTCGSRPPGGAFMWKLQAFVTKNNAPFQWRHVTPHATRDDCGSEWVDLKPLL
jgi:hypothetical protein